MNWRVGYHAHTALGTDQYPSFRMDLGGQEPRPAPPPGSPLTKA